MLRYPGLPLKGVRPASWRALASGSVMLGLRGLGFGVVDCLGGGGVDDAGGDDGAGVEVFEGYGVAGGDFGDAVFDFEVFEGDGANNLGCLHNYTIHVLLVFVKVSGVRNVTCGPRSPP